MEGKKRIVALGCGVILLAVALCQTAQATVMDISGASILADVDGTTTAPEALTISWSVTGVADGASITGDLYTYTYIVENPAGDVLLPGSYDPGVSEIVDSFYLTFDASVSGAVVSGPTGGDGAYDFGAYGLYWVLNPDVVVAGSSSGPLWFTSDLPPSPGNASASDDNPPSPWSSYPNGQPVPVPGTGNFVVPDSMNTMALLGGVLLLPPFGSARRKKRVWWNCCIEMDAAAKQFVKERSCMLIF